MKKIKCLVMVLSMLKLQDFQHFTIYILVQQSFPNKPKHLLSNDFDQLMFLQTLSFLSTACVRISVRYSPDTRVQTCWDAIRCRLLSECRRFWDTIFFHSWPRGLRFESVDARLLGLRVRIPPITWYISLVRTVFYQVEVSVMGRSFVQKNPIGGGVSECDREASRRRTCHIIGCCVFQNFGNQSPNKVSHPRVL